MSGIDLRVRRTQGYPQALSDDLLIFYQPHSTRSGRIFRTIADWGAVQPVVCPPTFDLSPLLKQAVDVDNGDYAEVLDYRGPPNFASPSLQGAFDA